MTRRIWTIGLYIAGVICSVSPLAAMAAPVPWGTQVVSYNADRRPVTRVLRDVLATQPFPVVIAADIRGEVTGQFNEPAQQIVAKLAAAYGLVWFFDGSVLYLSPISDLRTEFVELGSLRPAAVNPLLAKLGLLEARFPVRVSPGGALVSGPSRYVELVAKALRAEAGVTVGDGRYSAHSSTTLQSSSRRMRVFKLSHAQAGDVQREFDGRWVTIPGVATLLRRLGQSGDVVRLDERRDSSDSVPLERDTERMPAIGGYSAVENAERVQVRMGSGSVQVEADIRTNSVIVNASSELLDYYADVIRALDQPQRMVQIDVTILRVDSNALEELGVALGIRHSKAFGPTGTLDADPAGLLFQAVFGTRDKNLSIQIAALERSGKAKVLSRPKLVALENREAILSSRSTAYVRVAGTYSTDLYPVRAGLEVRLTPRVVSVKGKEDSVNLALDIVDGSLQEGFSVDGIPVTTAAGISTEATVGNDQTLLIGGHQRESLEQERSGVPGLSRLPGIGALFRRKRESHALTEQLFLITPRLVTISASGRSSAQGDPLSRAASSCPPVSSVDGWGGPMPMDEDASRGGMRSTGSIQPWCVDDTPSGASSGSSDSATDGAADSLKEN